MKAILEFNLPNEQSEFHSAVNGNKAFIVIWKLREYASNLPDSEWRTEWIKECNELLDEYNIWEGLE